MTRIKICGITNREDAQASIHFGADALGFIFVENTPRFVGNHPGARLIPAELPPFITAVAVCSSMTGTAEVRGTAIRTVQYYERGEPFRGVTRQDAARNTTLIHAFRVADASSLELIAAEMTDPEYHPHAILLDTYHKDKLGGSGETFNWELAVEAKRRFKLPLILAGGLTPDNVAEAIATVRPFAVDVSSGVEAEPGRKDHAKLKAFIQAVRRADASLAF